MAKLENADIHLHSTLRPFAEFCIDEKSKKAKICYQKHPENGVSDGRAKNYTQSDFQSLSEGNVKLALTAMYPIEQGWFELFEALGITQEKEMNKILDYFTKSGVYKNKLMLNELNHILKSHDEKDKIIDEIIAFIGHWVTSLPIKRIKEIISDDYNYFEALKQELDYLNNQLDYKKNKCDKIKISRPKIPKNSDELLTFFDEEDTMIVIPTIEGAASFVDGNASTIANGNVDFSQTIKNIEFIKANYEVFFVTLSHHFYNSINGHSQSVYGIGRVGVDQMFGKGNVITSHGWDIIKCLLSLGKYENSGKRILIDTKHMSIPARIEYYKFIDQHNLENHDDIIPIISSHSAFSGVNYIENIGVDKVPYSYYEVNIATEEVEAIFNCGGLIGLNFDQNVLSQKPKIADHDDNKNDNTKDWTEEQWAGLFVDNLLAMVENVVARKDSIYSGIWNIFALGSDFDGFIDPLNTFPTAVELPRLKSTLIKVLSKNEKFKALSFGLSAEDVVNKFMGENAIEFVKKYYWGKVENVIV